MADTGKKRTSGSEVELTQYLISRLADEQFAVDISHVKEIISYGQLTRVPLMPDFIRGIINLRGDAVPVIDLSTRFWNEPTEIKLRTCIVILELQHQGISMTVGVIVDAVVAVLELLPSDIEPAPAFGTGVDTEFIAGIGRQGEDFIILLNVNKMLSIDEVVRLQSLDVEREEKLAS
jgi:purine-binding chemotaxis protein CheW